MADQCLDLGYQAIKVHAWGDARKDAVLAARCARTSGDDLPLMYDGSAGFDLPDAIYLGRALAEAGLPLVRGADARVQRHRLRAAGPGVGIPLLVAETSDGAHMNTADFIAAGAATFGVRAGTQMRGGITGVHAHRAPGRRVPAAGRGARLRHHQPAPVHGNPEHHLLTSRWSPAPP